MRLVRGFWSVLWTDGRQSRKPEIMPLIGMKRHHARLKALSLFVDAIVCMKSVEEIGRIATSALARAELDVI